MCVHECMHVYMYVACMNVCDRVTCLSKLIKRGVSFTLIVKNRSCSLCHKCSHFYERENMYEDVCVCAYVCVCVFVCVWQTAFLEKAVCARTYMHLK
jgi:hypothetical protein